MSTELIVAILSSSVLASAISGIITLINNIIDKKSGAAHKLEKIDKKLDEHIAQSYRNKILSFQNECLRGDRHTYEQFSEVLEAIENYEKYCEENNVNNQKCVLAIEYIKGIYRQCQNTADFAPMSQGIINETELRRIIRELNQTAG